MTGFLADNFAIAFTNTGLIILEFIQTLPVMEMVMVDGRMEKKIKPKNYSQHIILNPKQASNFSNVLKNVIKDYEKKHGKIKGKTKIYKLNNEKQKGDNNYIG